MDPIPASARDTKLVPGPSTALRHTVIGILICYFFRVVWLIEVGVLKRETLDRIIRGRR